MTTDVTILRNLTITKPYFDSSTDGLGLIDGRKYLVENCIIDLSNYNSKDKDEAVSVTQGSSATFRNCTIKGAGKLFLVGCGDSDKYPIERTKEVILEDCILEDFCRRGPEVQSGMKLTMINCTIRNWGSNSKFDTRMFGAWAHEGGSITAINCRFEQDKFFKGFKNMLIDWINHICQSINDEGLIKGLFNYKSYIPGVCRGLTSGPNGNVTAINCTKNKWWIIIENSKETV